MGGWGAIVMSFFGAVFAAITLHLQLGWSGLTLASPFVVFAAVAVTAISVIRQPGEGVRHSKRAERAIMVSTIGEGIGLFIAGNLATNLHHPELLLPAMALVVGLHFLPIAHQAPFPPFYALGAALLLAAALGFAIPAPSGGGISGAAAAISLWAAALLAIRRDRRAKQAKHPAVTPPTSA